MSDRAFERLVRAHADAVHAYARALTNDPWLAEEAVQLTFVRAWKYQDSFRGEGSYEGWLLRICRNLVIDLAAERSNDRPIDDIVEAPAQQDDTTSVAELGEALAGLPAAQREVLTLCGLLGYDYASAAELLDVPVGTVRSRLHRGRAALDALLNDTMSDEPPPLTDEGGVMTSPNSPIADRVLERMAPVRLGPPGWTRLILLVIASAQALIALPWLIGSDPLGLLGQADTSHMTRDGAFGLAIGLAGVVTAWRHRYAVAAAILSVSILLVQFGTGIIDGQADRVAMWVELNHLPMTFITLLILVAARPERALGRHRPPDDEPEPISQAERPRLVTPVRDD